MRKLVLITTFMLACLVQLTAQKVLISGKVLDSLGLLYPELLFVKKAPMSALVPIVMEFLQLQLSKAPCLLFPLQGTGKCKLPPWRE